MIRQLVNQNMLAARRLCQPAQTRCFISYPPVSSIFSAAKETLQNVNKKVGEAAASSLDSAQEAASDITSKDIKETAKEKLDRASKAAGKLAADGLEKAESAKETIKDKADAASSKAKSKADDLKYQAKETAENAKVKVDETKKNFHDHQKDGFSPKGHVHENSKGYANLQDKGRKTPSEQNRPEDEM